MSRLSPSFGQDPEAAAWLAPRLTGPWGHVTSVVPDRFPAYVRILHPVETGDGQTVPWSAVAEAAGTHIHPLAQWNRVAPRRDNHQDWWRGLNPEEGHLPQTSLAPLTKVLARHTSNPGDCWFGLWAGYGWIHGSPSVAFTYPDDSQRQPEESPVPPAFPAEVTDPTRLLHLPARDYLLGRGPIQAASGIGHQLTPNWFIPQSPNLLWPQDRAWCIATEIDFDSTLVAGNHQLITELVDHPHLEVWQVQPHDSLQHNADHIN